MAPRGWVLGHPSPQVRKHLHVSEVLGLPRSEATEGLARAMALAQEARAGPGGRVFGAGEMPLGLEACVAGSSKKNVPCVMWGRGKRCGSLVC